MKVIIAGASGMVGSLVLKHCLASEKVSTIISLVRKPSESRPSKLSEVLVSDFANYEEQSDLFREVQVAFFCLGAYTGRVSADLFKAITVDYALAFAEALEKNSPGARICLLSGAGADQTEKSKIPFALYKGMAENGISRLQLQFHSFRPAYIYPVEARKEPNLAYRLARFLYPAMKCLGPSYSIPSTDLARAMFEVGMAGGAQEILENRDIVAISKGAE